MTLPRNYHSSEFSSDEAASIDDMAHIGGGDSMGGRHSDEEEQVIFESISADLFHKFCKLLIPSPSLLRLPSCLWLKARNIPNKPIQEKLLTVTLVTVTHYRAIWLQWHFSDFPITESIVKFSCYQWHSISHSLGVTLFSHSRGCHCNRLLL